MSNKLLLAVITLTFPVLAHAKLSNQLRALADAEDPNSASGRTYEFKRPVALSQLDRKIWFGIEAGEKEDSTRAYRISEARAACIKDLGVDFDFPCVDEQNIVPKSPFSGFCETKPAAYVVNGKVYSPDDLIQMMPLKKETYPGTDYYSFKADCTQLSELFKNGHCHIENYSRKPFPNVHSLAISSTDGWNSHSEHSVNKLLLTAYYPVDEAKTKIEPKSAKLVYRPSCTYKNTGDTADFKLNATTHAMMMRHYGALLKEGAATPTDSGKINDSSIKQVGDTAPADSTGSAGSKARKVR